MRADREQLLLFLLFVFGLAAVAFTAAYGAFPDFFEGYDSVLSIAGVFSAAAAAAISLAITKSLRDRSKSKRIFFVYSPRDAEIASMIARVLKGSGFDPWLAEEHILPGQLWREEFTHAFNNSSAIIVLLTENLLKATDLEFGIQWLFDQFRSSKIKLPPVIPIRIDSSPIPEELSDIQTLDFNTSNWDVRLLRGLESVTRRP